MQGHFSLFKISFDVLNDIIGVLLSIFLHYIILLYLRLGNRARTHQVSVDIQASQIPWSVLCSLQF